MSRNASVVVVGAVLAGLMLSVLATDAPSAAVLAALTLAVAVVAIFGGHGTGYALILCPVPARAHSDVPSFTAGRVTDPLHHPLRPRAPGLV
jgi:hypothetical protein